MSRARFINIHFQKYFVIYIILYHSELIVHANETASRTHVVRYHLSICICILFISDIKYAFPINFPGQAYVFL